MDLSGKKCLLTGGGTGIGRELAIALGGKSARIILTGRRPAPLRETAELVRKAGGEAHAVAGDITDGAHHKAILDAAETQFGGLDVLINNAGNVAAGRLEDISDPDIRSMLDVNLLAPILLTRAALPLLRRAESALVVNVSSGFGLIGMPFYSVYCATKAGCAMFGEALRRELTGEGVHPLTVYPGATDTPMMATSEVGTSQGVTLENPATVAAGILEGMEKDMLSVVFGGEERLQQIRTNQSEPERLDATLAERKPALEAAVKMHRAM